MKTFLKQSKTLYDFSCLLAMEVFLFLLLKDSFPIVSIFVLTFYWYLRTKNGSFFFVCLLFLTFLFFNTNTGREIHSGRIVEVHNSYSILQKGKDKILLYSNEPLLYDSEYIVTGDPQEILSTPGFFRFDFANYCKKRGVPYSVDMDGYQFLREHFSIRSYIQKCILKIEDEHLQNHMNHLLLNIKRDNEESSWFYDHGFSYSAILIVISSILKFYLDKKIRNRIIIVMHIIFLLIYHFPLLLFQSFLFRLCSFFPMEEKKKLGMCFVITMLLYPYAINNLAFLIPAIYRIFAFAKEDRKWKTYFSICLLQSYFYQSINLFEILFYPILRYIIGIGSIFAWIQLFFPAVPCLSFFSWIYTSFDFFELFDLPGSILCFGLIFYILLILCIPKKSHFYPKIFVLFLLFQTFGLFHPFAEISFLNVGQGDSILIRLPFHQGNVLIDTGKPTQWNALDTFLSAKGIKALDTLIITHSDDDHSGNQEKVIEKYEPKEVYVEHFEEIKIQDLEIYDLNEIRNEDENQSSIVNYLEINGLKILLMADADQKTEEDIIERYGNLKVDILKLSHHGSKTGSSSDFLNSIQPKLGIISCGNYFLYHHPSEETIQRLLQRHIPYFLTREEGDISIFCIGPMNLLLTSTFTLSIL